MLTAGSRLLSRLARGGGPEPSVVAGHSLGEYTALVAAGALRFADALPLVRFRAQAMQEAVPVGRARWRRSSASTRHGARRLRERGTAVVEAVNFNEPEQTVIAGRRPAWQRPAKCSRRWAPSARCRCRCPRRFIRA